jgi:hypothetical protein
MKSKNIFWGVLLVGLGVLFILKNLGVIYFSWHDIFRIWPLLLVLIGITILPIKPGYKALFSVIALIVAFLLIFLLPHREYSWESRFPFYWFNDEEPGKKKEVMADQKISEVYDTLVREASLNFDAAAGNFRIRQESPDLFEFEKHGDIGKYNYSIKNEGQKSEINFQLQGDHFGTTKFSNDVEIKLNPKPAWELKIDVGAADIDMDLSAFKARRVDIDGGASSIKLRLGSLQDLSEVFVDSGASSIHIEVPESIACEVNTSTILSSKNLKGFEKVADGTYVTPGFSKNTKNIIIAVDAAVSSLEVTRY